MLFLKTLSKEFFAAHAGLFLFGFYLLFGIVESSQLLSYHKTLMLLIYSSPLILALVFVCWALYALKCLFFVKKQLKTAAYQFVFLLGASARKVQFRLWLKLYALLFLPILLYLVPFVYVGLTNGSYVSVFAVFLYVPGLLLVLSGFMFRIINYSHVPAKVYLKISLPQWSKPYWTWPFYYLLKEQTLMLFASKVLSFALFNATMWVFADVSGDVRVSMIGILAAVLSHSMLLHALMKNEVDRLSFTRSLPITLASRLGQNLLVLLLLFVPELLFYVLKTDGQLLHMVYGLCFGLSGLMGLQIVLYWINLDQDQYLKWLLGFFFVSMFVVLAHYYLVYSLLIFLGYIGYFFFFYHQKDLKEM
ncbi:hypothetical protein SAMN04488522_105286 [Pedobacter caeni]|uniref:Uncharacterized protein n=2 Tax=Pedobacter caeni TaxID=288992 RepID=A0A1M5JBY2_9SPHI|nr:hypothetical protein SAMN04488522_105286 [Pedobacter caeni]